MIVKSSLKNSVHESNTKASPPQTVSGHDASHATNPPKRAEQPATSQDKPTPQVVDSAPSVDRLTAEFRAISTDDLRDKLETVKHRIADEDWIQRANSGSLSKESMNELDEILNTETAVQIVLIERDLARAKEKYL